MGPADRDLKRWCGVQQMVPCWLLLAAGRRERGNDQDQLPGDQALQTLST